MDRKLPISITLNCALTIALVFVVSRLFINSNPRPVLLSDLKPLISEPAPKPIEETGKQVFSWSQIESTDYRTYIVNLRSIGCPEQTIRDIITADVHELLLMHHKALQRTNLSQQTGSFESTQKELARLDQEAARVIAALLGPSQTSIMEAAVPSIKSEFTELPLAFVIVDPSSSNLHVTSQDVEVIEDLRQRFQQDVGALTNDPNDPAYLQSWQLAKQESDDLLQAKLGSEFFLEYQLSASRQSVASQ
jgi:hypothetical protein